MTGESRGDTGRRLAGALANYAGTETVVLGAGRRNTTVAADVAHALALPLDVVMVHKIAGQTPAHSHVGAVAEPDHVVLNHYAFRESDLPRGWLEGAVAQAVQEVGRSSAACRGTRARREVKGQRVIVVAASAGTGTTLRAAVKAVRALEPREIVVAIAVAPPSVVAAIQQEVDRVVCLAAPLDHIIRGIHEPLDDGIGDADVRHLLEKGDRTAHSRTTA